jgi:hypothetical protein
MSLVQQSNAENTEFFYYGSWTESNLTSASFGRRLDHAFAGGNRLNLFLPPSEYGEDLCSVPVPSNDGWEKESQDLDVGSDNANGEGGSARKLNSETQQMVIKIRYTHQNNIAILIKRSTNCSVHTQALNALELDQNFHIKAQKTWDKFSSDEKLGALSPLAWPRVKYIVVRNTEEFVEPSKITFDIPKNDDYAVPLYVLGLSKSTGDQLYSEMLKLTEKFDENNEDLARLTSSAFLPLATPYLGNWYYPTMHTNYYINTGGRFHKVFLIVFPFLLVAFPLLRVIYYCCTHYRDLRWRRNERGWITGITFRNNSTAANEARWMAIFGYLPTMLLGTRADTLTEAQVKSLPTIKFGKDDVNEIVEQHRSTSHDEHGLALNDQRDNVEVDALIDPDLENDDKSTSSAEESNNKTNNDATNKVDVSDSKASFVKAAYDSCATCSICICEFEEGEELRLLPECGHIFHTECILPWLTKKKNSCPLCQREVIVFVDDDFENGEGDRRLADSAESLEDV